MLDNFESELQYWCLPFPQEVYGKRIEKILSKEPVNIPEKVLNKWKELGPLNLGETSLNIESLDTSLKVVNQLDFNNLGDYYGQVNDEG